MYFIEMAVVLIQDDVHLLLSHYPISMNHVNLIQWLNFLMQNMPAVVIEFGGLAVFFLLFTHFIYRIQR